MRIVGPARPPGLREASGMVSPSVFLPPGPPDHGHAVRARLERALEVRGYEATDRVDRNTGAGGERPECVPAERRAPLVRSRRLDGAEHGEVELERHRALQL